jgi:hypothetical protein
VSRVEPEANVQFVRPDRGPDVEYSRLFLVLPQGMHSVSGLVPPLFTASGAFLSSFLTSIASLNSKFPREGFGINSNVYFQYETLF